MQPIQKLVRTSYLNGPGIDNHLRDKHDNWTEEYARHVARDGFFWAWPLVNVYNKRLSAEQSKELAYAGPVPGAPLNRIVTLTDYVAPDERIVACPNQDVAYGGGSLGLEQSPVVIQAPDFGERFWVYQAVDLRTDSFVQIGKIYRSTPGFYLLVGPNWQGGAPAGITELFRSPTNTGFIAPTPSPTGHDVPACRVRRHDAHRLEHDYEAGPRRTWHCQSCSVDFNAIPQNRHWCRHNCNSALVAQSVYYVRAPPPDDRRRYFDYYIMELNSTPYAPLNSKP